MSGTEGQKEGATGPATPETQKPRRVHLGFLDGLRGLSAVWVLFYHTYTFSAHGKGGVKPHGFGLYGLFWAGWMGYGDLGVRVFLVLSGFLLMQPLAAKGQTAIADLKKFFKRRCLRIMPGYYGVLLASIILLTLFLKVASHNPTFSKLPIPPITGPQVWVHLFMVQNFSKSMQDTINGPMWTVGTEFQIYLLFPLLLLPMLKRLGPWLFLVVIVILSSQVHWIGLLGSDWIWNGPPFPVCFAVGMVASLVVFGDAPIYQRARKLPLGIVGAGCLLIGLAALVAFQNDFDVLKLSRFYLELPFILGIGLLVARGGVIQAGKAEGTLQESKLLKVLGGPGMVTLAGFSYSLYLTHHPIVILLSAVAGKFHLPALMGVYAVSLIALCICLPLAYGVSLLVEKPFLAKREALR